MDVGIDAGETVFCVSFRIYVVLVDSAEGSNYGKDIRFFYDADAIEEVYPENEVAGWVWEACQAKIELLSDMGAIAKCRLNRQTIGVGGRRRGRCDPMKKN